MAWFPKFAFITWNHSLIPDERWLVASPKTLEFPLGNQEMRNYHNTTLAQVPTLRSTWCFRLASVSLQISGLSAQCGLTRLYSVLGDPKGWRRTRCDGPGNDQSLLENVLIRRHDSVNNTTLFHLSCRAGQPRKNQLHGLLGQRVVLGMDAKPSPWNLALLYRPVIHTFCFPMVLVKRCVPPIPGIVPKLTSGKPNLASDEAKIISHYAPCPSVTRSSPTKGSRSILTSNANSKPPPNYWLVSCLLV